MSGCEGSATDGVAAMGCDVESVISKSTLLELLGRLVGFFVFDRGGEEPSESSVISMSTLECLSGFFVAGRGGEIQRESIVKLMSTLVEGLGTDAVTRGGRRIVGRELAADAVERIGG
jgi:hypothetical protein